MTEWETFCDECYYHMWRVRRKNGRHFNDGFHVNNREEAHALVELLNKLERERDNALSDAKQADTDSIRALAERNEAREQLALERALADRLAALVSKPSSEWGWEKVDALAAWKEARATPAEKKSDFS